MSTPSEPRRTQRRGEDTRTLILAVLREAERTGETDLSVRTIARRIKRGPSTVQYQLRWLEDNGIIRSNAVERRIEVLVDQPHEEPVGQPLAEAVLAAVAALQRTNEHRVPVTLLAITVHLLEARSLLISQAVEAHVAAGRLLEVEGGYLLPEVHP